MVPTTVGVATRPHMADSGTRHIRGMAVRRRTTRLAETTTTMGAELLTLLQTDTVAIPRNPLRVGTPRVAEATAASGGAAEEMEAGGHAEQSGGKVRKISS